MAAEDESSVGTPAADEPPVAEETTAGDQGPAAGEGDSSSIQQQ